MVTTVKQSVVDSMSLLGPLLPSMSSDAINEMAVALSNLITSNSQAIASNNGDIYALQQQVARLPNLQDTERQEVLDLISAELDSLNIDTGFVINYGDDIIDAQVFLQMLANQQAAKPTGVEEVTRTDGYVTSAKLTFSDGTEQTVSFTRTVAADVATYLGQISDGAGSLMDGYEFKLGIQKLDVPGLNLTKSWDGDLISQKMFVSNLSVTFVARTPPDNNTSEVPETL
ncbi:MAG: hypothetical protein AAF572_11650 [Cyanobacteria bacterium P01_B01_bin.77]